MRSSEYVSQLLWKCKADSSTEWYAAICCLRSVVAWRLRLLLSAYKALRIYESCKCSVSDIEKLKFLCSRPGCLARWRSPSGSPTRSSRSHSTSCRRGKRWGRPGWRESCSDMMTRCDCTRCWGSSARREPRFTCGSHSLSSTTDR